MSQLNPQQQQVINSVRPALAGSDSASRAEMVRDLLLAVHDYVKFEASEGGGLDGRAGPEREAFARLIDQAEAHIEAVQTGLPPAHLY